MAYYLKLYFAILAAFLAIDAVWLGLVARSFYKKHLGYIMAPSPNWIAAAIFYLIFIAGIMFLAVLPGLKEGSIKAALLRAALLGLVAYATYDLTNLAVVKDWPVIVTVVDLIWGTALSTALGWVGFMAGRCLS